MQTSEWHIITGEYPPQIGGVSDHTRVVAEVLAAAGDRVHVWRPASVARDGAAGGEACDASGVCVHREMGRFAPSDLRRAGRLLDQHDAPRRLVVQYVPHGFGFRAVNVPFCLWLWRRAALSGDEVELIVHEPFLEVSGGTWKQTAAAMLQRLMAVILLRTARRVWVTIPAWEEYWRPYAFGRRVPFEWLPVPTTVPAIADPERAAAVRSHLAPAGGHVLGHFGTYGRHAMDSLRRLLPSLLTRHASASVLLLGLGGDDMRDELLRGHPGLAGRVHATGKLPADELSAHLRACDLLIQPYPDGVSTRRTSAMAGLAHGLAVVTTLGRLSEPLWAASRAVALVPAGETEEMLNLVSRLLADEDERRRLGEAGLALYRERFEIGRIVEALRRREADELEVAAGVVLAK